MTQLNLPKTTEDFLQQCKALKEKGLIEEALSVYRQAIELYKNSYELYHFYGETLALIDKLDDAIDAYQKAIEINPEFHWSHHCLSLVYLWQSKYDQAIEYCKNSIQINPEIPPFYDQMGLILNHKGQFKKAQIFYQRALDIGANKPDLEEFNLFDILGDLLQTSKQQATQQKSASTIEGSLEEIDGCLLKGWVWDSCKPDENLTLVVYQDNEEILRFVADRSREDLERSGIGMGNYGFAIRLPLSVCQAAPFKLKIAVADSDHILENSSINFEYQEIYKTSFQGVLEPIDNEGIIKGWALDNRNLEQKINVYIYEGHDFLMKFTANLYREDIHKWKKGDGLYGYWLKLPDDLLRNQSLGKQEYSISICWENSAVELNNSPMVISRDFLLNFLLRTTKKALNELVKITGDLAKNY